MISHPCKPCVWDMARASFATPYSERRKMLISLNKKGTSIMNRVTSLPSPAAGGLVQAMRRHPVVSFFVLAYAISWVLWIPVLVFHWPTFDPSTHAPSLYIL